MANWQERFDALLKGMSKGEPHKAGRKTSASGQTQGQELDAPSAQRRKPKSQ